MKVAITVWEERVSPVFDAAHMLHIVEMDEVRNGGKTYEVFTFSFVDQAIEILMKNKVKMLICGAISQEEADTIERAGVSLFPFITGEVAEILRNFAVGNVMDNFAMPGCLHCTCPKKRG